MRIERAVNASDVGASLDEMATAPLLKTPVCAPDCTRAATRACTRDCPHICEALSSDPQNHPIEAGVAPLVFEIKKLGVFTPCWSCEGHNDQDGRMRAAPAVWFYAHSVTHARVLNDVLVDVCYARRLSASWGLGLTFSDPDNLSATFSLTPSSLACAADDKGALSALRCDIKRLAEELEWRVADKVKALQRRVAHPAAP